MGDEKHANVLDAAATVFFRYGFRRTTMGDLAQAAGLSRPALYLRFCNKERIFEEVVRRQTTLMVEAFRMGVPSQGTVQERLRFAFDLWVVRPYTLMTASPDARDLVDCVFEFAQEAIEEAQAQFERTLRDILASVPDARPGTDIDRMARLLATSARGLKATARSREDLEATLDDLLKVVLAAMA